MRRLKYFQDSRYRKDRITMVIVLSLAVILLAGIALLLRPKPPLPEGKTPPAELGKALKEIDDASRLFSEGNPDAARRVLLQVDLERARSAEGWELAGMLEEAVGNNLSAMTQYTRGLAIRPASSLYWHRAHLLRQRGDLAPAMKDMDLAAAAAPRDITISNERLLLMVQAGLADQANAEIKALREHAGTDNSAAWIFGLCGVALHNGEYSEAKKLLAVSRASVPPRIFDRMLKDPVIVRHMARPEITAFYLSNLPK
jgi:tetratricopeptide (TPR) repeat protein